jgi:lipid II:glycine glycyltransferase (peptidoglycan interpeptide bridge formation enzyme)
MYTYKEITDRAQWDAFIDVCDSNTFLNSWSWSEVEGDLGRTVYRQGIYRDGELVGVVLSVVSMARRGNILICPHGPVLTEGTTLEDILSGVCDELRKIGSQHQCVCIRMCPLVFDTEKERSLFLRLRFRAAPIHVYSELSWMLDITPSEEVLLKNMKKNTRYGIRKADKDGVEVVSSTDPKDSEVFWNLYITTADRQGFVVYPRALIEAEFARFREDDRARWYFARYNGEVVSAALIVYNSNTAFYHHGASLHSIGSITPGEALQWKVIQDAKALGLTRYNFWGVVPDEADAHPWAGLSKFKKGFGGYAESYVHAQDLPLSPWYWITWTIETIRRWKRKV